MRTLIDRSLERAKTPQVQKAIRYSLVSVVSVLVTTIVQIVAFRFRHWPQREATILGASVAAVPSYYLNRMWAWGKSGRSHLLREVLPFWVLVFIGLGASTLAADFAKSISENLSRNLQTVVLTATVLLAFSILWIVKFIIFNKILFAHHPEDLDPVLDGRSGLPT